ncbi:MAG: phosphoenolpyruvate synthase [Gemmatimonas sp.]|uniref:phosphoenolpyruvate synthase n=1 Tax=Gemmatimonas sp. TaxID=1962908 RepID=UPI0022BEB1DF|nr:phosphoenolpyruvate synthase [Gemmatimonas sp.]MCE2953177.1 phosphoenolpyruvate synthase [Gemmatimonas sp.]MCZ8013355.1 phosphoenolpyruvate synthase [Gemmatimonas sp.]MCZ8268595.1 phosphoenolpyruvate synthase [Gemmatimonas sp.]
MTPSLAGWFDDFSRADVAAVGGKNASLGEMRRHLMSLGIAVPDGFALTTAAYRLFIQHNGLAAGIAHEMQRLRDGAPLSEVGAAIRGAMLAAPLPDAIVTEVRARYAQLATRAGHPAPPVAVRSSATAEDLPDASFAGQQESFLNVVGEASLLATIPRCFASLYTDRAIAYRAHHGIAPDGLALSVGVQQMVRSDVGASGVAFTLDTESGFRSLVILTGAWGLGENVVKGVVNPDEWRVFKPLLDDPALSPILDATTGLKQLKMVLATDGTPVNVDTTAAERTTRCLSDQEVLQIARWCTRIEAHYGCPMDVEWAKDGLDGALYIVQARPETVRSREQTSNVSTFTLEGTGPVLVTGVAVGSRIASGRAIVLSGMHEAHRFEDGAVLVARQTDPDWVPVMKRASAIVTDSGGRTSHAAIVSRELGIAAIVGATGATAVLNDRTVTVSCAEGQTGTVYEGALAYREDTLDLEAMPRTRTAIMLNVADPAMAMRWWRLPVRGIGLARIEFVIEHMAKAHPMALLHPEQLSNDERAQLLALTQGHDSPAAFFVDRMAAGIGQIAASQWPEQVIVRFSDFKTNEYAGLLGGRAFEPHEENPMIGFRGASRYYDDRYREGFGLECRAIRRVRETMGLRNVVVMIPFCRTLEEADKVLAEMQRHGLVRGEAGLEVYVMAEIPSNVLLAREFGARFDGFSIGSNDLTQLTLGVDRDNALLASLFDERNPAVLRSIERLIADAHAVGCKVGICGQAPSDYPEFAEFLVRAGIDSISLNPDSVVPVLQRVAALEANTAT